MVRIVVATVVHHPEDARIRHRQIPALLAAGFAVTYIAPAGDTTARPPGLRRIEVPRATGRRRLPALNAARRALAAETGDADLAIVHDPELTLLDRWIPGPRVWDVHEDLPAQISDKSWVPASLRGVTRGSASHLYRRARDRFHCIIAEGGYAEAFPDAELIRNAVDVPVSVAPSEPGRAVYLGRVSGGRGAAVLAEVSRRLPEPITLEVFGQIDADTSALQASSARVHGFVPNDVALRQIEGATVGLSLLDDLPNYRHSMPTKILEYLARGLPVITTPLPEAVKIVDGHDCGIVVPFGDAGAVVDAIVALDADPAERRRLVDNGRRAVREHYNWADDAASLVQLCRRLIDL